MHIQKEGNNEAARLLNEINNNVNEPVDDELTTAARGYQVIHVPDKTRAVRCATDSIRYIDTSFSYTIECSTHIDYGIVSADYCIV